MQRKSAMFSRIIQTGFVVRIFVVLMGSCLDSNTKEPVRNEREKPTNSTSETQLAVKKPAVKQSKKAISIREPPSKEPCTQVLSFAERSKMNEDQPFLGLPAEMMDEIISHLPIISQAYLVLSCKRLHRLFGFILQTPEFRYPYSDGLDQPLDLSKRTELLISLECLIRWKYCAACLKLHRPEDFDETHFGYNDPHRRTCQWPGIIVLCPCLKFRPKRLIALEKELSRNSKKVIFEWHSCAYGSHYDGISYELTIAVSLNDVKGVIFHLQYLIHVNMVICHRSHRRIMLCPHKDALRCIKLKGKACVDSAWMDCEICEIYPDIITVSNDSVSVNVTTYDIHFTRGFRFYHLGSITHPSFRNRASDYNWKRYTLSGCSHESFTQLKMTNVFDLA